MIRVVGNVVLLIGTGVTAYAALAFFLLNFLPPNGGFNGRLPSLYLLFAGMAAMLLGAALRGLRRPAAKP